MERNFFVHDLVFAKIDFEYSTGTRATELDSVSVSDYRCAFPLVFVFRKHRRCSYLLKVDFTILIGVWPIDRNGEYIHRALEAETTSNDQPVASKSYFIARVFKKFSKSILFFFLENEIWNVTSQFGFIFASRICER